MQQGNDTYKLKSQRGHKVRCLKKTTSTKYELFKTDTTWFHMFKEIIHNGTWARLSSNSKLLYPVIKACIDLESGSTQEK